MTRTRVKVCGICTADDADAAVSAGADAIGMVFYPKSPRHVSISAAREIASSIPPFVTTVGLMVAALPLTSIMTANWLRRDDHNSLIQRNPYYPNQSCGLLRIKSHFLDQCGIHGQWCSYNPR